MLLRRSIAGVAVLVLLVFTIPLPTPAHPGNTDGNGCHTCRTNCTERWGIPYGYYHRHYPVRDCFEPPPTTTTTKPTTTTTRSTTTTISPPTTTESRAPPVQLIDDDLGRFREELGVFVQGLDEELQQANQYWESRSISYGETHSTFTEILESVEMQIEVTKADLRGMDRTGQLSLILIGLDDLRSSAQLLLAGLEAPDDGSQRREALVLWSMATAMLDSALAPTALAPPDDSTTTTTLVVRQTASTSVVASEPAPDRGLSPAAWIGIAALIGAAYSLGRRNRPDE